MDYIKNKIVKILTEDSRTTPEEIAEMLQVEVATLKDTITQLENDKIILKYTTALNREKITETVSALIEVKVTPQKGSGFEALAQKICAFNQVQTLYLISGDYDFLVILQEKNMKKVAEFVHEKLAGIDGVVSTATHFVLKGYKESGVIFDEITKDDRLVVSP